MVVGVTTGFTKGLEISGVGYRAQLQGTKLVLALGYSHPVEVDPPEGISFQVETPTKLAVVGADKELVGQIGRLHPLASQAGALQGQGDPVRRRADPAQGRQGRQGRDGPSNDQEGSRATCCVASATSGIRLRIVGQHGAPAALDLPQRQVHLRPGDRRQQRTHARLRLEPGGDPGRRSGQGRCGPRRWAARSPQRAKAAGVSAVVLDRGGYRYHGRVRSLTEGAREGGLDL